MPEKPVYYTDTLDALKRAERAIGEASDQRERIRLPPKTDIKVSVIATTAGIVEAVLRGWLETV